MKKRLYPFDLHSHTLFSKDGLNRPQDMFKWMKKKNLKGMALTEHERASILKAVVHNGRFLLPACEFKSTDYGELIGLFINDHIKNRTFVEIAEDIHDQAAFTVLPHPRDPFRKQTALMQNLPDEVIEKHVDFIEGINSRCLLPLFNTWAQNLAQNLNKPMTAGSDAHSHLEIGHAKTWFERADTPEQVYKELKKGNTRISGRISFPWVHLPSMLWQRARKL
jgi:predicted metal-dependent phosphoesterase TrpH